MIYLAVNYGECDGWRLTEYKSPYEALKAVRNGETLGLEWTILKELDVVEIVKAYENKNKSEADPTLPKRKI